MKEFAAISQLRKPIFFYLIGQIIFNMECVSVFGWKIQTVNSFRILRRRNRFSIYRHVVLGKLTYVVKSMNVTFRFLLVIHGLIFVSETVFHIYETGSPMAVSKDLPKEPVARHSHPHLVSNLSQCPKFPFPAISNEW